MSLCQSSGVRQTLRRESSRKLLEFSIARITHSFPALSPTKRKQAHTG